MDTEKLRTLVEGSKYLLGITRPVEIRIRDSGRGEYKDCAGYAFVPKSKNPRKHVIYLNLNVIYAAKWDIASIVAHELIHCAQFDHKILGKKHHDKRFQSMAKILKKGLRLMGISVKARQLYNPASDTE